MAVSDNKRDLAPVPYTSFRTLMNTADRMKDQGGAPSRVDRSYLANMPGGERGTFTNSLKVLGLITDDLEPTDDLNALINADEAERKQLVKALVERVYGNVLALPAMATQHQLEKEFRDYGVTGSTMRRAIAFFLAAANFAGIRHSPHFKLPQRERRPANKARGVNDMAITQTDGDMDSIRATVVRADSDLHPLVQGLINELPTPGSVFPKDKQDAWFEIAKATFRLIYKSDAAEQRTRTEHPASAEVQTP